MEYKVEDTELTLIADAIRSACNLSDELEFPSDFIAKIDTLNSAYVGEDESPYLLRQSPTDFGSNYNSEIPTLIGGSIAWNQLVQNGNFVNTNNWATYRCTLSASNNILTVTATNTEGNAYKRQAEMPTISGHKYLFHGEMKAGTDKARLRFWAGNTQSPAYYNETTDWVTVSCILNSEVTSRNYNMVELFAYNNGTAQFRNVFSIDLTATFGTEIADYVYGLEQSTAGSGIAWLKSHGFFTKDYYAYNEGSLVSVKTSEHRTTGKNLLPQTRTTQTVNGVTFTVNSDGSVTANGTAGSGGVSFYPDVNTNTSIGNGDYIVTGCPTGGGFQRYSIWCDNRNSAGTSTISTTNDSGGGGNLTVTKGKIRFYIFIASGYTANNLVFKPMFRLASVSDATYEPYESHSYSLDSDLELRGIPKLSNGSLFFDGDEYMADGTVTRKYGIVDLGTLDWSWSSAASAMQVTLPIKLGAAGTKIDALVSRYYIVGNYGYNGTYADSDKILWVHATNGALLIKDSAYVGSSSISDFTSAMSGVYLVYPLATPTTETADPFASPQIVDPNGTEEYVDTRSVPVPVGHRTEYNYCREVV